MENNNANESKQTLVELINITELSQTMQPKKHQAT